MASRIAVTLDYERRELLRDGWGKSLLASAIPPAQYVDTGIAGTRRFDRCSLPAALWREPHTGIIMLRPSALKEGFWNDAAFEDLRLGETDWRTVVDTLRYDTTTKAGYLMRASASASLSNLDSLRAITIQLLTDYLSNMACTMETHNPFAPNEGWAAFLRPYGIFTDRTDQWLSIEFGDRYCIRIGTGGEAVLLAYDSDSSEWRERMTMAFGQGGVDHTRAFQLTVIPWGSRYISIIFSQARLELGHLISMGQGRRLHDATFLYDMVAHGETPNWDSTLNHYVKTPLSHIRVAFAKTKYAAGIQLSRIRYDTDEATLYVLPQLIEVPRPAADVAEMLQFRGHEPGVKDGAGEGRSSIITTPLNQANAAFTPATDTQIVAKIDFQASTDSIDPSKDGLYSPELWSLDYDIPEETHTPDRDPITLSEDWNFIEIRRGVDPDVSSALVRLEKQSQLDTMFRFGGPILITDNGTPIFEGNTVRKPTTLDGPKVIVQQQLDARDLWLRLNEMPIYQSINVDGKPLLETVTKFIKRAGFTDADINTVDPDGYIDALALPKFDDPNDQLNFSEDATCGDVIRSIIELHSLRPIRIRPVNGQWKIYLAPQYDSGTPPTKKFYLRSSHMVNQADAARWAANEFKVLTKAEWSVEEPEFNTLLAKIATASEAPASAHMISISNEAATTSDQYKSVQDKTWVNHMGRVKVKMLGPQDLPMARTKEDGTIQLRTYFERRNRGLRLLEFGGEWNSTIDADDFIWLIGLDENLARVSYGAYRIENLVAEIDLDFPNKDSRWAWFANYCCHYVGPAVDGSTPMWTASSNLPTSPAA